jgi:hypothetical protein
LDKTEQKLAPLECLSGGGREARYPELDRMQNRAGLTYANIVSTIALFLALGGGAALAAERIHSGDIAPGSVHTSDVFKRAITAGKLALGAVRSNQIADGAVDSKQIDTGAVGSAQIGAGSVAPSNLQFPVYFVASPTGGSAPVTDGPDPYPLADGNWVQKPGEINVVFGGAAATLAYDGSGSGSCRVFFEVTLNGQQVGGGEVATESTTPQQVEQSIGAQPQIDPTAPSTNHLSVRTGSNDACTPGSTIDSTRFRVLDFG